jgi:hypothetical protein
MNKHLMIVLGFVLGIGGILFFDEVLSIFAGMSVLEAMRTIWTFVLHVVVTTVLGYVVIGLSEIVKPWVRMLRRSGRAKNRVLRRGETAPRVPSSRAPRMNKDAIIAWLASQKFSKVKPRQTENQIRFKF